MRREQAPQLSVGSPLEPRNCCTAFAACSDDSARQKKVAAQNAEELAFMRDVTRSLSLASGQGAQRGRISAARQRHAWFGRHGGIARFANAEAVGKSRFVLGGSVESGRGFHVSPNSTTECSGDGSEPQTSKPDAGQRAQSRGSCR